MPDFREYVRRNLPPLNVSGAREAEIVEELTMQIDETWQSAIRNGLSPDEAWQQIARSVPSWPDLARELQCAVREPDSDLHSASRSRNIFIALGEDLVRNVRFAARRLMNAPAFTAMAVITLALGIGANTAIFSLLDAVMLRSLPVRNPQELVWFGEVQASGNTSFLPHRSTQVFSYPFFKEFRRRTDAFVDVAAIDSVFHETHGRVRASPELEKLGVELVSGNYFQALGVNAVFGRTLSDGDDQTAGAHPVAVASYSWWQRRFPAEQFNGSTTVKIGAVIYSVVGIARPGFFGATVGHSPDLWIPLSMTKQISPGENGLDQKLFQFLHLIARRKPGVGLQQAQTSTNYLFRQILLSYVGPQPAADDLRDIRRAFIELKPAATGRSRLRVEFGSALRILMAVVGLVLLIACANVANLLLARAAVRQREIAVRMSIGAQRSRLIGELLVESGLLGLAGTLVGVALASGATRVLLSMVSTRNEALPLRVAPDLTVLCFTAGLALFTVFLFGTMPALHTTAVDLANSLKEGRGMVSSTRNRFARGLVVGQVTLSLVLLAAAGLFLRSLVNVLHINTGFDQQNVLMARIDPASAGFTPGQRMNALLDRVQRRVSAIPGVHGASFAVAVFEGGGWSHNDINVPGRAPTSNNPSVDFNIVDPDYFDVMKMPILAGRGLTERDNQSSRRVAVINETMARAYLPPGSPIGRVFGQGEDPQWQNVEVVGVVKDAKYMDLEEEQMPAVFYPRAQHGGRLLSTFVARYYGSPALLAAEIRRAVAEVDPNLPVSGVVTLAQAVGDSVLDRRLIAQLSAFFGLLASFLACIGIYGVTSYGIARRTSEFGIRMALGADRRNVLWIVLRETLSLAIVGVGIGLVLALASGRFVRSELYGIETYDPTALGLATVVMILVAAAAGLLPARRATTIDPAVALRYE